MLPEVDHPRVPVKTPTVHVSPDEMTSPVFCANFAAGCSGEVSTTYKLGPWAGFGSPVTWPSLRQAIDAGEDWYYGDNAYFGRKKYYRVTKNAMQHTGVGRPSYPRLHAHHPAPFPEWRRGGRRVVVCCQSEFFYTLFGTTKAAWLTSTLTALAKNTDRPVLVRNNKRDPVPFLHAIADAWCVVTLTSNAAVDAIVSGVPAICTAPSAASVMARSDPADVENLHYPEGRRRWAAVLAANQWTMEEIRRGLCWRAIR